MPCIKGFSCPFGVRGRRIARAAMAPRRGSAGRMGMLEFPALVPIPFAPYPRLRMAGGTVLVRYGVEGHMRPAFFDDPAEVRAIWLNSPAFDDQNISLLKGYKRLWRLDLSQTKITSAAIKELDCRNLSWLQLRGTNVDSEGIRWLAERCPHIHDLDLGGTRVTDDGVRWLCGLANLWEVCLDDTGVSDRALRELEKAPRGLTVVLTGTKVTRGGIEALARARSRHSLFLGREPAQG